MSSAATLILAYFPTYGYVALFFLTIICGTYIPIPASLILITVGAFARAGHINIFLAFCAALAGSIMSDFITFYIARRFGRHAAYKRYVENHKFAKRIETYVQKYPKSAIFVSRLLGFSSTPVNALTGLSQVQLGTFLSVDALGNGLCTMLYLGIGYLIGITAAQGTHFTNLIDIVFGVIVLFYIIVFVVLQMVTDIE